MDEFKPYERQFTNQDRKIMLATSLKNFRHARGYSQKEVADLLDIKLTTYSGYERGANEPNIETLVRLSFLFGVSVDTLLQRNNMGTKPTVEGNINDYKAQHDEMMEYFKESKQPVVLGLMKMIDGFIKQLEKYKENIPDQSIEDIMSYDIDENKNNESVDKNRNDTSDEKVAEDTIKFLNDVQNSIKKDKK